MGCDRLTGASYAAEPRYAGRRRNMLPAGQAKHLFARGRLMQKFLAAIGFVVVLVLIIVGVRVGQKVFFDVAEKVDDGGEPAPADELRAAATWNYWQGVQTALNTTKSQYEEISRQSGTITTPEQAIAQLTQHKQTVELYCEDLNNLPVLNVDPEVTSYITKSVALLREEASFKGDLALYIAATKSAFSEGTLEAVTVTAVIQFFLGDPRGAFRRVESVGTVLAERGEALSNRKKALDQRVDQIESDEVGLRVTLAQRYNREFPRLN